MKEYLINLSISLIIMKASPLWQRIKPEMSVKKTVTITNIDKEAPVVSGVTNNQLTNHPVTITFNEGTATLNGEAFESGTTVSNDGEYDLVVTDLAGNMTSVHFGVDSTSPEVSGVTNNQRTNQPVTITFNEGTATLNGEAFESGSTVSNDGEYDLVVTDLLAT